MISYHGSIEFTPGMRTVACHYPGTVLCTLDGDTLVNVRVSVDRVSNDLLTDKIQHEREVKMGLLPRYHQLRIFTGGSQRGSERK